MASEIAVFIHILLIICIILVSAPVIGAVTYSYYPVETIYFYSLPGKIVINGQDSISYNAPDAADYYIYIYPKYNGSCYVLVITGNLGAYAAVNEQNETYEKPYGTLCSARFGLQFSQDVWDRFTIVAIAAGPNAYADYIVRPMDSQTDYYPGIDTAIYDTIGSRIRIYSDSGSYVDSGTGPYVSGPVSIFVEDAAKFDMSAVFRYWNRNTGEENGLSKTTDYDTPAPWASWLWLSFRVEAAAFLVADQYFVDIDITVNVEGDRFAVVDEVGNVLYNDTSSTFTLKVDGGVPGLWRLIVYKYKTTGGEVIDFTTLAGTPWGWIVMTAPVAALLITIIALFGKHAYPFLFPALFIVSFTGLIPTWVGFLVIFLAGVFVAYKLLNPSIEIGLDDSGGEDGGEGG